MQIGELELASFLAAFARTAAWMQTAPLVSDKQVNARVRTAVAALLAVVLTPLHPVVSFGALFTVLPQEIFLGLVAGFAGRLMLFAAETGGQMIGTHLSLNFAATLNPDTHDQDLPTTRIAYVLAGLAFLAAGGLERSIAALAMGVSASGSLEALVERGGAVLALGLRASAPMMVAALVANLAVALASRAAPAMNVFSVMLAAVLVVGGVVLIASSPMLARVLFADARMAMEAPAMVLQR